MIFQGLFILFGFIAVNCQECEWPNQFGWTKSIASSFYITPVDIGMFDSGEVLNSVFSTNITSNDFVQRSLITSFLESRVAFLNANPDNPQYFLLGSEERTHWRILLTQILRHLENFPFDTSAHLWASKIYKRLGDSIQSIEHAKSALRLIDEILVQLSKSYRNDGGIKVGAYCIDICIDSTTINCMFHFILSLGSHRSIQCGCTSKNIHCNRRVKFCLAGGTSTSKAIKKAFVCKSSHGL